MKSSLKPVLNEDIFGNNTDKKNTSATCKSRANDLNGADWTKYSISVWSDIKKTRDEMNLNHPAMFPEMLTDRLIRCFTKSEQKNILDPFMGSGSTMISAHKFKKQGIGFEISDKFVKLFLSRYKRQSELNFDDTDMLYFPRIYQHDARVLSKYLDKESIDLCITSPPYWDILDQKRTADGKAIRNYGDDLEDLGKIKDYDVFLSELGKVWLETYKVLKNGAYMIINVMDLRKKDKFFPLHIHVMQQCIKIGSPSFILDDIIIWNRQGEYNNLRPLGYPYKFRINKIHEYLLIFQKPDMKNKEKIKKNMKLGEKVNGNKTK